MIETHTISRSLSFSSGDSFLLPDNWSIAMFSLSSFGNKSSPASVTIAWNFVGGHVV